MVRSTLTALQTRVLRILAVVQPGWTLTGGAALCGFHLGHRTTRDLDLFWHGSRTFTREPADCEALLRDAGIEVHAVQRGPSFVRLQCVEGGDSVLVDLVAEPVPTIEAPQTVDADGVAIRIDSEHEIFVNKLGTLLHRAELRDLVDLRALLARGADLRRGMQDAARKDSGFSPLMVGHLLHSFPLQKQARAMGMSTEAAAGLAAFKDELASRIADLGRPDA